MDEGVEISYNLHKIWKLTLCFKSFGVLRTVGNDLRNVLFQFLSLLHSQEYPGNPSLCCFRDKNSALPSVPKSLLLFRKLFLWLNCSLPSWGSQTLSWMMLEEAELLLATEVATNKGLKGNGEKMVLLFGWVNEIRGWEGLKFWFPVVQTHVSWGLL